MEKPAKAGFFAFCYLLRNVSFLVMPIRANPSFRPYPGRILDG